LLTDKPSSRRPHTAAVPHAAPQRRGMACLCAIHQQKKRPPGKGQPPTFKL